MTRVLIASLLLLPLAACGSDSGGKSTAKLDAVEVQPGTISDSMIILDDASSDGTAVDNSVPDDDSAKSEAKPVEESADEETTGDNADSEEGQMISAPVAKKAPAEEKK